MTNKSANGSVSIRTTWLDQLTATKIKKGNPVKDQRSHKVDKCYFDCHLLNWQNKHVPQTLRYQTKEGHVHGVQSKKTCPFQKL